MSEQKKSEQKDKDTGANSDSKTKPLSKAPKEFGGYENKPDPTRYGDWDANGRCSDF